MTGIGGVQGTAAPGTTATAPKQDIFGGLGPDAFLKLLVAQLRYQNPMNPSDPTAMMGQIAQYAQVEALTKLQQGQSVDQSLSEARLATDLVGKFVTASDGTASEAGKVVSARFTATGPMLVLDNGAEVTLSAVTKVDTLDPIANTPAPAAAAPTPAATPAAAAPTPAAPATPAASTPPVTTSTTAAPDVIPDVVVEATPPPIAIDPVVITPPTTVQDQPTIDPVAPAA